MAALPPPADDPGVLRRQLLIELSVLRRRYAQLSDEQEVDERELSNIVEPPIGRHDKPVLLFSSSEAPLEEEDDDDDEGLLCQSDRDAIEALFHSVDDFTRDFNEGKGGLERGDIVSKILRGKT